MIRNELMKKDTVDKFFKAFTDGVTNGIESCYRTNITVTFGEKEK